MDRRCVGQINTIERKHLENETLLVMRTHGALIALIIGMCFISWCCVSSAHLSARPLHKQGENGFHTCRIPASLLRTRDRPSLCEDAKASGGDSGDIAILLRRSGDNGDTWSEPQVIWDDPGNTSGNPCVVVDRDKGVIWLLMTESG